MGNPSLPAFHPVVARWFRSAFDGPTAAQERGWNEIAAGHHTLIEAPTGSGKTLAAFLWCLNDLVCRPPGSPGVQVLYLSPLKALNNDIQRNLRGPLEGLGAAAVELGLAIPEISVDVRTGDTPQALRARQVRRPPEVLITTPESLYLLLTARKSRGMFAALRYVVVDEIHAVAGNKRGTHLALSLERLEEVCASDRETSGGGRFVRIGLSATQRPLETVARLLGGYDDDGRPRPVSLVRAHEDKRIEVDVTFPYSLDDDGDDNFMTRAARFILDQSSGCRSTLVFCNARHVTERLSEVLNATAGSQVAVAHHGSIARERRLEIEQALKEGRLPLLIATSSLELGIDVGSVDLVIQIGSTKSVSRALQRIGRAGHQVGAVSRGRIVAMHAADLLDAAACVRGLRRANIEITHIPHLCLDVLAQQIVAMAAERPRGVDEILRLARRSEPFHALSRPQLENVLAMLSGSFADVRFEGLRARLEWDREAAEVRALPGALRLAVVNAGTIPDRGYLSVELAGDAEGQPGKKLGELDEEFAAELYVGGRPAFSLGTSVWGVEAVERDRVLVRPAPGEPYQIPFWRGDRLGRTLDYGAARLVREIGARLDRPEEDLTAWLGSECGLTSSAAAALADHVRRQEEATGQLPHDQTIVVESFQDEIGDGRVVIHSLFGAAVNGAWAFALKPRLREALGGIDPLVLHNDDGIIMRLPPMESPSGVPMERGERLAARLLEEVRADNVEELLIGELADAPMLALRFREAAQRALLLPKLQPNRRTPLWLRRQRSADLLSVVRRQQGFPVLQEAVRECLHDTWDLNGLRSVLRGIEAGDLSLKFIRSHSPSPFAATLVWDFGLAFGEAGDAPRGECRAAYLALNRELLRETLEAEDLRRLLDVDVIRAVEQELAQQAGEPRAAGELDRLRAAVASATGSKGDQALLLLVQASMQYSGPVSATALAEQLGLPLADVRRQLNLLVESSQLSCGEYHPEGNELEYCTPLVLARLHRESLRQARERIAPVDGGRFASFLLRWQGVRGLAEIGAAPGGWRGDRRRDSSARHALETLTQLPLSRELWPAVLAARLADDFSPIVDDLTSRGLLRWRGAGHGRLELVHGDAPRAGRSSQPPQDGPGAQVLEVLREQGALFSADVARRLGQRGQALAVPLVEEALAKLEDAGLVCNDLFSGAGRWSLAAEDQAPAGFEGKPADVTGSALGDRDPALAAYVEALLRRYGVVCRTTMQAEISSFRWSQVEHLLRLWEWRGRVLRGDFVRDLPGPQFAVREAVDRLREEPEIAAPVLLAWEDPANAWRKLLPLPAPRGKGRFVVLLGGLPVVTVGGWGRDVEPASGWADEHASAVAEALSGLAACSPLGWVAVERWRRGSVLVSPLAGPLRERGFARMGLRLVRRPPLSTSALERAV